MFATASASNVIPSARDAVVSDFGLMLISASIRLGFTAYLNAYLNVSYCLGIQRHPFGKGCSRFGKKEKIRESWVTGTWELVVLELRGQRKPKRKENDKATVFRSCPILFLFLYCVGGKLGRRMKSKCCACTLLEKRERDNLDLFFFFFLLFTK